MLVHLDSSAVVAVVLDEPSRVAFWEFADIVHVSDLAAVEVRRVLHRLRLDQQLTDEGLSSGLAALVELERRLTFVEISRHVLGRAGEPFPTHLRTLDAIHLATALLNAAHMGEPNVTFITHDRRQAAAARALGFDVVGVGS